MVRSVESIVNFYKFGLSLQLAEGAEEFVRDLLGEGKRVFLDYKYYDVPETVRKAVSQAAKLGVSFLTIHGVSATIRGAVQGRGDSDLKLFAVTVLTSMEAEDLAEVGCADLPVPDLVAFRARKALEAGCDGVIASGLEARRIKAISGGKLLIITPGIRPQGYPEDDQKRKTTTREAIAAGADYLVVGRPILAAPDPLRAAEEFVADIRSASG
jgi:orotidine-5'-phosphate decarboxylase